MPEDPGEILMFTQPRCTSCEAARLWLEERGVSVRVVDIRADYQALYDFMDTGSRTTPTLMVGEHMLEGFDPDAWTIALREAGCITPA